MDDQLHAQNEPELPDWAKMLPTQPDLRFRIFRYLAGDAICRQLGILSLPVKFKLSVVMPVYNECRWIAEIARRVLNSPIPKEIIIVDDGSTDGTQGCLAALKDPVIRVIYQPVNRGKGAALQEAFKHVTGDIVVIQDADLEYDPLDYPRLIMPIVENKADIVFGSRFLGNSHRVLYYWHYVANRILTTLSNTLTNLNLTDMEAGYKAFRREVLDSITLRSKRFGFEPEFTAKVAHKCNPPWRIYEVPISYSGRTYEEGKKIGFKDAVSALYSILRFGLFG